ncbi:hypothetical protein [Pollutibacter soli]|uniref:hypothetical protein n=1 Tax=Pollutibacter soli TaxID=3034157 RepID=UPI0030137578
MKNLYEGYSRLIVQVHYMIVLSELENYSLPTNDQLVLNEYYLKHHFPWHDREKQATYIFNEDPAWFLNYE